MKTLGKLYRRDRHISRLILMLILWLAFMAITCFDKFFTIKNFQKIASAFPEYGLMALGAMVCMITGGIDLSSVGIANLTGIAMATFMKGQVNEAGEAAGWVIPAALIMSIICGMIAGGVNGVLISKIKSCTDSEARYAMMHIAEDLLMQTGCITPLYFYTDIYMIDDSVKGFYSNPLGYKYFMHCTIEK